MVASHLRAGITTITGGCHQLLRSPPPQRSWRRRCGSEKECMNKYAADLAEAEPTVVVSRQWGDWRKIRVPISVLSDFHITTQTGGVKVHLARPTLAAYRSCEDIPAGADFAHTCRDGPPSHRIKVLILSLTIRLPPTESYTRKPKDTERSYTKFLTATHVVL